MLSFFAAPLKQIQEGLEIAFENGGRLADVSPLLANDSGPD
jgi:hypothetical protein